MDNDGPIIAIFTIVLAVFTVRLANATDKLVSDGQDNFKVTQRAFIFLEKFETEITVITDNPTAYAFALANDLIPKEYRDHPELFITRFAVQPIWKNGGDTPTKNMTIQVHWDGPRGRIPPAYDNLPEATPFFIGPKAAEGSEFLVIPGAGELVRFELSGGPPNSIDDRGGPPLIFIWGKTEYYDIFGDWHFVQWCYQLRLDAHKGERVRATFIQWGDYNRTDET